MQPTAVNPIAHQEIKSLLDSMVSWETPMLESFAIGVNEMVARRKSQNLSKEETELLKKINEGIPSEQLDQYNSLITKQKTVGLTEKEQMQLTALIDFIEKKEAELLSYMIDLSRLRKVSLEKLRKQLGIKTPAPNAR